MVRPVGIDHADLGDGGIALFADEIVAAECKVVHIHSQAVGLDERLERVCIHFAKAVQRFYLGGNIILCSQRFGLVQRCLAALHGVDDVLFDSRYVRLCQRTVQQVHLCGAYCGSVTHGNDLHALRCAVRSLIVLTGQELNSENGCTLRIDLFGYVIQLRLGKHGLHSVREQLLGGIFHVVAVDHAHALQGFNAQKCIDFFAKGRCLVVKSLLFFYVNSKNHVALLSSA